MCNRESTCEPSPSSEPINLTLNPKRATGQTGHTDKLRLKQAEEASPFIHTFQYFRGIKRDEVKKNSGDIPCFSTAITLDIFNRYAQTLSCPAEV